MPQNDDLPTGQPTQFSLALFDSKPEILKKPVQAVHMAVTAGQQTRIQRLAFNVMLKNAHDWHAKNPGATCEIYEISRSELMAKIDYTSPNRAHLKATLKAMQKQTVEWDILRQGGGGDLWASTVLLPTVAFDDTKVYYSYAPAIKPMLLDSKTYARLDIGIQRQFRLDCSAALYEWCNRFRNNPSKLTNDAPWQEWRWVIHGHVEDDSVLQEYKYFKKRKLLPAIAEINALSDLEIELIETREGSRRVKNIQFKVTVKEQYSGSDNDTSGEEHGWKTTWDSKLKSLKVPLKDRTRILATYAEPVIEASYRYTVARMEDKSQEKLQHPGKYFVRAIDEGYAPAAAPEEKPKSDRMDLQGLQAAFDQERTTEAQHMFREMTEDQQAAAIENYNQQVVDQALAITDPAHRRANRYMVPFYAWLARTTWPAAGVQELLEFAVRKGLVTLNL